MKKLFLGIFQDEDDILEATKATRQEGYEIHDVYTPYVVHGLDEAMGIRKTRLTWICFGFGLFGLLFALWLQFWIGSIDWPLNVGGRPFNSLPAYLPVTFEVTVLFAGLGVVGALLFRTKLFPGQSKKLINDRVTDDLFVLAVLQTDAGFSEERITGLWEKYHVAETREVEDSGS